ncbi:S49 family peptidase [Phaeovulum sp.]|uniref:S49 family peptidase n=1 Tax=Phaeovulum sp. TaxID=2934796 RepID=UPI002730F755|nr:S49 family peptidase [Phaeovulum sp.]MDP1669279.1 S49 family peptidase [Phaeovulum sp.]MDZ4119256.1 S49 family peptidase [Phaeovulum sp.]
MDIRQYLPPFRKRQPRVAVVRLQGAIGAARPGAAGLSDAALGPLLERAFRRGKPAAVALVINSPGGSPVQSALIAAHIRRLADETKLPVHAFVEDIAASGGYWLASAADDIWADATSLVGSIGVISAGFGLAGLIERYGVERRVHTAGSAKSFMDPFRPEKPEDVVRLLALLEPMHAAFKAQITDRRGAKLAAGRDLFTGDIWVGQQALEVGLIDGIAHLVPKLKALYGDKVRLVQYGLRRPFWRRFGAAEATTAALSAALDLAEERALWSRYGL